MCLDVTVVGAPSSFKPRNQVGKPFRMLRGNIENSEPCELSSYDFMACVADVLGGSHSTYAFIKR
jgi:hypothetical protein